MLRTLLVSISIIPDAHPTTAVQPEKTSISPADGANTVDMTATAIHRTFPHSTLATRRRGLDCRSVSRRCQPQRRNHSSSLG